jgi:hypothetical protein
MTTAAAERPAVSFRLLLWTVIFPALGLWLYFGVFAPQYAHEHHTAPLPTEPQFNCQSAMADMAQLGDEGQISPLCNASPYPEATP